MRYLGIDYGGKRVGIAESDAEGKFAFPKLVIKNSSKLADEIANMCKENKISRVVIGESLDYNQKPNPIMEGINKLITELQERQIAIDKHPEFLSSIEAQHIDKNKDKLDARAAAIILQDYLDVLNRK